MMPTPQDAVVLPVPVRTSHARFVVIAFLVGLSVVTYLDRACVSTMVPNIKADFSLTDQQMSWVFSSFAISYAIFQIPTAWIAQRLGTRRVITRIVLWWSVFTLITAGVLTPGMFTRLFHGAGITLSTSAAWIIAFWTLLAVRFLFGMGEAGAWACSAASFAGWIPTSERGIAQGIFFAGAHISGGVTPFLVLILMDHAHLHWRTIFLLFGMVGFIWAGLWYHWYRDDPAQHQSVNPAELEFILAGRNTATEQSVGWVYWRRLITHRNIFPLCLMYIGNAYAFFFCITWLPTYMKEQHHLADTALGIAAGLPGTLSVVGDVFGGLTTDWLTKRFGSRIGRCGLGAVAYALAALAIYIATVAHQPWVSIWALAIAVTAVMFTLGAAWGTVMEIGGDHTGIIGAVMNTAGNAAAIFSPVVAIYAKNHLPGGWNAPLYVIGGLFAVGAVAWCFIDPKKRVFD